MDVPQESSGQSPEAHGLEGEVQDVKPAGTSVTAGQGHEAGEKTKRADEQGAAGKVPCPGASAATAAAMKDDEERGSAETGGEERGSPEAGGDQERGSPETGGQEHGNPEAGGDQERGSPEAGGGSGPLPKEPKPEEPDIDHSALCHSFSQLRLCELEHLVLRTQYPEIFTDDDPLDFTEPTLQSDEPEEK